MADRLAVMDQGVILQLGTPSEVYERPASVTVAQFIGSPGINLLPGKVGANGVVEIATAALPLRVEAPAGSALTLGVRPESIHVRPRAGDGRVACRFHRRENLGSESILHFDVLGVDNLKLLAKVAHGEDGAEPLADGTTEVGFAPANCHVFDAAGQRLATETHGPAMRRDGRAAVAVGQAE
jgi:multiple sugar transport system ATP-binding protein